MNVQKPDVFPSSLQQFSVQSYLRPEDIILIFDPGKTEFTYEDYLITQQLLEFMRVHNIKTVPEALKVIKPEVNLEENKSVERMTAETMFNAAVRSKELAEYLKMFQDTSTAVDSVANRITDHMALLTYNRFAQMQTEYVQKFKALCRENPPVTANAEELAESAMNFFRPKLPKLSTPSSIISLKAVQASRKENGSAK